MKLSSVVYLCNALDEDTKNIRSITTDSPAATKKIFGLCYALRTVGVDSFVLSMGRGRQNNSFSRFSSFKKNVNGIPVSYAVFWHISLLTHFMTAFSLMLIMGRIVMRRKSALLVYNRLWHYIPAICVAKLLGVRCYLDLEDGYIGQPRVSQKLLCVFFDWACNSGSLLACTALSQQVNTKRNMVCYGVSNSQNVEIRDWTISKLKVLLGGTLEHAMGASLLLETISFLHKKSPATLNHIQFIITGKGGMAKELEKFSAGELECDFRYYGDVSGKEFSRIRDEAHVGLSLNLALEGLSTTVFPSKTIELASQGLLLIATPISDLPKVFSEDNALLLPDESPESLEHALSWVVTHRDEAALLASKGHDLILNRYSLQTVGLELKEFLL